MHQTPFYNFINALIWAVCQTARKANINFQNFALVNKNFIMPRSKLLFLGWSTWDSGQHNHVLVWDRVHSVIQSNQFLDTPRNIFNWFKTQLCWNFVVNRNVVTFLRQTYIACDALLLRLRYLQVFLGPFVCAARLKDNKKTSRVIRISKRSRLWSTHFMNQQNPLADWFKLSWT